MWWESLLAEDVKCFPLKHGPLFLSPLSPETDESMERMNATHTAREAKNTPKKKEWSQCFRKDNLGHIKIKYSVEFEATWKCHLEYNDAEYPKVHRRVSFRQKGILFIDCRMERNRLAKKFYQQFFLFSSSSSKIEWDRIFSKLSAVHHRPLFKCNNFEPAGRFPFFCNSPIYLSLAW